MTLFGKIVGSVYSRLVNRVYRAVLNKSSRAFGFGTPRTCEWKPEDVTFKDFYSFHDEKCKDVAGIGEGCLRWRIAHFFNSYPLHTDADAHSLSYQSKIEGGEIGIDADGEGDHWINFVSKKLLPAVYAVEFDYMPNSVFNEQLQFCFAAKSLAERHRFVLNFNEVLYYQVITRGFWLPKFAEVPCSLPLGEWSHVRLEVVGDTFSLSLNGRAVLSVRDSGHARKAARNMLIFWNGKTKQGQFQEIALRIRNFKYNVELKKTTDAVK